MMTLAKALKTKNLLVASLNKVMNDVQNNNSILVENDPDVDVTEAMERFSQIQAALIGLKTAITVANVPIQGLIYAIAENKSQITFLQRIPTLRGKQQASWREEVASEYKCVFTKAMLDQKVKSVQKEIASLQEEIEKFNHTTLIEVDVSEDLLY